MLKNDACCTSDFSNIPFTVTGYGITGSEIPSHKHDTYEHASGRVGTAASSGADGLQWGVHLSGTWTIDTGAAGGSAAHNNMPPYLSVYVWKRTA